MINSLRILLLLSLFCHQVNAEAAPSKFPTITEAIESLNDYSEDAHTFNIIKANPLHIQLAVNTFPGDLPEVIESQVMRAVIYGIYRTFLHTNVTKVTVTGIPMVFDLKAKTSKFLKPYSRTIEIDKQKAEQVAQKIVGVKSIDQLVGTQTVLGDAVTDMWTSRFEDEYYSKNSPRGLANFYAALAK